MYREYRDQVQFFFVYIREAHPDRQFPQPASYRDRVVLADTTCSSLNLSIPTLVDRLDDGVATDYGAFPDRLYLIDRSGTIAYQGERGPDGFAPQELERAIRRELSGASGVR